jgi:hypothetical protein
VDNKKSIMKKDQHGSESIMLWADIMINIQIFLHKLVWVNQQIKGLNILG